MRNYIKILIKYKLTHYLKIIKHKCFIKNYLKYLKMILTINQTILNHISNHYNNTTLNIIGKFKMIKF